MKKILIVLLFLGGSAWGDTFRVHYSIAESGKEYCRSKLNPLLKLAAQSWV